MPVMDESERLSSLIAEIYDAALEPATWPRVLERSASFVHGIASALFMKDFVRKNFTTPSIPGDTTLNSFGVIRKNMST